MGPSTPVAATPPERKFLDTSTGEVLTQSQLPAQVGEDLPLTRRDRRAFYARASKKAKADKRIMPGWRNATYGAESLCKPNPCVKRFKMPDGTVREMSVGRYVDGVAEQILRAQRGRYAPKSI